LRRLGKSVAASAVCGVALGLMAAAPQVSSADPAWQLQTKIAGERFRPNLPLLGISCPSASLCVAVGELDRVVSSANPTGGSGAWNQAEPLGEAESDCHESWSPPCRDPRNRTIRGVSCPSVSVCVAVTGEGYVYSSTRPTGSGDDWRVSDIDGDGRDTHLWGVSCPTTSLCVAVSGERYTSGKVLTSTNPTGGAAAWNEVQLDPSLDLRGVSCGTPTLCVAVAQQGRMLVSTNPTGGPSAWREIGTPGGPGDLQGVSCAATVLCVAGNAGGNLLTSTNPLSASSWREVDGGPSVQVTGVSCLPTRQCLAVDNNGDVMASPNPTSAGGSWSLTRLIPYEQPPGQYEEPLNGLFGASCASRSFCAVVGADGRIFTSTNPFDPPSGPSGRSARKKHGPKRPKVTIARLKLPTLAALRKHRARVKVRFFANGPVRRFECNFHGRRFHRCHSPAQFRVRRKGDFSVRIRAVGRTGLRGPVAIKRYWVGEKCTPSYCLRGSGELPLRPRHR
jgi:hypothetical protein